MKPPRRSPRGSRPGASSAPPRASREGAPEGAAGTQTLVGIHAVREALRAAARPLQYLAVVRDRHDARVQELLEMARAAQVPVRFEPREALDRLARTAQHQGVVALAAAKQALDLDALLDELTAKHAAAGGRAGLLLALDGVEDPHNLGAILRSACGTGVEGVILPTRQTCDFLVSIPMCPGVASLNVSVATAVVLFEIIRQRQAG